MNKQEQREWIEMGKMLKKLGYQYYCYKYKDLKIKYFDYILGCKDSEEIELELEPQLLEKLYEMSDEKDIPIDELIMIILVEYMKEIKKEPKPEIIQYRLLNPGEIIEKGDEFYSVGEGWVKRTIYDNLNLVPARRKIVPITGYRLLNDGEIILESDEYFTASNWFPSVLVGIIFYTKKYVPYRRKIK
jgi:hypothetical protein